MYQFNFQFTPESYHDAVADACGMSMEDIELNRRLGINGEETDAAVKKLNLIASKLMDSQLRIVKCALASLEVDKKCLAFLCSLEGETYKMEATVDMCRRVADLAEITKRVNA